MGYKRSLIKRVAMILLMATITLILAAAALPPSPGDVVGTVQENLSAFIGVTVEGKVDSKTSDTPLGRATADAVRLAATSDLAIVNGGVFRTNLLSGRATYGDLLNLFYTDDALGIVTVTPKQLVEMLEAGVSKITVDKTDSIQRKTTYEGFPQVAGLTFVYDASAQPGDRIVSVTLANGTRLDPGDDTTQYTLAASVVMLDGGYGMPAAGYTPLNITLSQALAGYITVGFNAGDYNKPDSGRISVIGTTQSEILRGISGGWILICAAVLIASIVAGKNRYNRISLSENRMYPPQ